MKPKFLLSISVIFLSLNFILAKEVPLQRAETVAKNIYAERINAYDGTVVSDLSFSTVYTLSDNQIPLAYVFNVTDEKGLVIIAAQDNVHPVLAYTFSGAYNENDYQPAFFDWIQNYKDQIYFCVENNLSSTPAIDREWNMYAGNSKTTPPRVLGSVAPLIKTKWNQDCGYNAQCPAISGGPCGKAYTGCVATAMAQMMKYHAYPSKGTGSYSYTWSGKTLSANFGATTYNWSQMSNLSATAATAQLMYHSGVALNMNYGSSGSSANSHSLNSAMYNYFGYRLAKYWKPAYAPNDTVYQTHIAAELDSLRPVFYGGKPSSGPGHEFLCDGYQGVYPYHFHFNWGWGGAYNGYFYLSALNPGSYNFTSSQSSIIRVMPANTATGIESNGSSKGMIVYPNPSNGEFAIHAGQYTAAQLEIYNVLGEKVYSLPLNPINLAGISNVQNNEPFTINLSSQPSGIYFLHFKSENSTVVQKIIKQ